MNKYVKGKETFTDGSYWDEAGGSEAADNSASPDGNTNSDTFTENTATTYHGWNADSTNRPSLTAQDYSISVYLTAGTRRYVYFGNHIIGSAVVDTQNWTITETNDFFSGTVSASGVIDCDNGIYRCWLTGNPNASGTGVPIIRGTDSATGNTSDAISYLGESKTIIAWGYQMEAGSTPSSYIPTTTATVTRTADTLTIPAANLPYSSTAMGIQMEGRVTYADEDTNNNGEFFRWLSGASDYINWQIYTSGDYTGGAYVIQRSGGTTDFPTIPTPGYSAGVNTPFNIAARHGSTFINGAVDGTALTENSTPTALPDLSATDLNLGYDFNGTISRFVMFGTVHQQYR